MDLRDKEVMREALDYASWGLGVVWPNPSVGCVVRGVNGEIVGKGRTLSGGRPHAEKEALREAGEGARGGEVSVTLEPCNHEGESGSCVHALLEAGVRRVVVLLGDVDVRVRGGGVEALRRGGVEVEEVWKEDRSDDLVRDALRLNGGYILNRLEGRPLLSLKVATTLDGKMGLRGRGGVKITNEGAHEDVHRMRGCYDGILVGWGTVKLDDPLLTCRIEGESWRSPLVIVLDKEGSMGRLEGEELRLMEDLSVRGLVVLVGEGVEDEVVRRIEERGASVRVMRLGIRGGMRWRDIGKVLGREMGLTRVMVEGGRGVFTRMLNESSVDRLYWYRDGSLMGSKDGLDVWGGGSDDVWRWKVLKRRDWGSSDLVVLEEEDFDERLCGLYEEVWV
jgi:diaminohydroxyphosphoribosylaminopyrimidine deaminase/5-amino-6-(5-phosphoribosylamino)uracil reductase